MHFSNRYKDFISDKNNFTVTEYFSCAMLIEKFRILTISQRFSYANLLPYPPLVLVSENVQLKK
jgi:hypothetical protein